MTEYQPPTADADESDNESNQSLGTIGTVDTTDDLIREENLDPLLWNDCVHCGDAEYDDKGLEIMPQVEIAVTDIGSNIPLLNE